MNRANMPEGWEPPAPAWTANWGDNREPLVATYFAVQGDDATALDTWAAAALTHEAGVGQLDRGEFVDAEGVLNRMYIAYWFLSGYQSWCEAVEPQAWWHSEDRLTEGVGYWREVLVMPQEQLETLHSTPEPDGAAVLAPEVTGPIEEHGYAGAMRDRIPVSVTADLRETVTVGATLQRMEDTREGPVRVQAPHNMCVIRSGQNWGLCAERERQWYLDKLHPVLITGMNWLRDNPLESRCLHMRFVNESDAGWTGTDRSFGLGYATDVFAFEEWAKSHPTHLDIFGGFMEMVTEFGEQMKLRLWHEVTVLDTERSEFEYINCHANTGLLGYTD